MSGRASGTRFPISMLFLSLSCAPEKEMEKDITSCHPSFGRSVPSFSLSVWTRGGFLESISRLEKMECPPPSPSSSLALRTSFRGRGRGTRKTFFRGKGPFLLVHSRPPFFPLFSFWHQPSRQLRRKCKKELVGPLLLPPLPLF